MAEMIDALAKEKARAELTLNRHGFKDNGGEVWDPPVMRMPSELMHTLDRAQTMVNEAHIQRDLAVEVAKSAIALLDESGKAALKPKVVWPEPGKMNFTPERRDPYSMQDRHVELRRRSTDIKGEDKE